MKTEKKVAVIVCGLEGETLRIVNHAFFETGRDLRDHPKGDRVIVGNKPDELVELIQKGLVASVITIGKVDGMEIEDFLKSKIPGFDLPISPIQLNLAGISSVITGCILQRLDCL